MHHTLHRLMKWLGCLALGCYVIFAVAFLAMRYWVFPNINQWRVPVQQELSTMLGAQVQLGEVAAEWRGRHPRILLHDARLRDAQGRTLLEIPSLDAVLSWRSLLAGRPAFVYLRADGVELSARRDAHGRISLMGMAIERSGHAASGEAPAATAEAGVLHWLSRQRNVQFTNATVHWQDAQRNAPVLELSDVAVDLGVDGDAHIFSLYARPPAALGDTFKLQGRVRTLPEGLDLTQISGLFHVGVQGMRPDGWRPWMDVRSVLEQGEVDWQGWQEVVDGQEQRHVSIITVRNGVWRGPQEIEVKAADAQLYVAGQWSELHQLWSATDSATSGGHASAGQASKVAAAGADRAQQPPASIRMALRIQDLSINAPGSFDTALVFADLAISAGLGSDSERRLQVQLDRAQLRNADMDLDVSGGWREHGGEVGLVDLQGRFGRLELPAIVRYLPAMVDEDARAWMRRGLLAGRLSDAMLRLRGDPMHFPYGDHPDQGDFYLGGAVHGVVVDYAPAAVVGPPGWPRLERLQGHAQLHRVDLKVRADAMQMRPAGKAIDLEHVHAHIRNIEKDAVLEVHGTGKAEAAAFLSLVQTSPLAGLLDGMFDDAQGQGQWEVPIALTIPLLNTDASTVAGSVVFKDAELKLSGSFPPLSRLNGTVNFTEESVTIGKVQAHVLGGPVTISGGLGKQQKGLTFEGRVHAKEVDAQLDGRLNGVLGGATSYRLTLHRDEGGAYGMQMDSTLEGMSIGLPQPLAKAGDQRWPLRVQWKPARGRGDAVLEISLRGDMLLRLLHRPGRKNATFFHAGALSMGGAATPAAGGIAADIHAAGIDVDAWRAFIDDLSGASDAGLTGTVLPPLRDLRVQAGQAQVFGMTLDHLTFTARRSEDSRWRIDVSSTQTAGTVFWRPGQEGKPAEAEADFERLAIGETEEPEGHKRVEKSEQDEPPALFKKDEIRLPAVRLKVNRLRLHGRDLGALTLRGAEGENGRLWALEQFELSNPHGVVKGRGAWRLLGPQPGVKIQANAAFENLGSYLQLAGFQDLMEAGHGSVHGEIEWRGAPWRFERSALQGDLTIDLAKGRLISLGSRSARLLEVLSLQSVKRLASMDWNPGNVLKQGFPFDTLQGHITLNDGVLHSENYRVVGPVGTIMIAGDVNLPKESLDLQALVVPNLDVSGAAIAAGIAVNPIVGLGAFLTQWLLKDPLGQAMAVEYRIRGDFDDPQVDAVTSSSDKRRTD